MTNIPNVLPRQRRRGRVILKFLGLLIGTALFIAIGFGAGFIYFADPLSLTKERLSLIERGTMDSASAENSVNSSGEPAPKKVPRIAPEEEKFVTTYYEFPEALTANLRESRRFLQIGVGLSTQYDESVMTNVAASQMALKSDILAVISSFSELEVDGKPGRDALAAAIRDAINARLVELEGFGGIEAVFFPSFILQ